MRFKKLFVGAAATVAIGTAAGVAVAVWSVTGSGSGGGAATVAQSLVVTPVTPTGSSATLYPGGPAGPVYFMVQNPNPYAVTITSITWGTPVSSNPTACANSNISIDTNAPKTGLTINVPANTTTPTMQLNGVLDLSHAALDGCQGVSFTAPMTVSGTQQ